MIHKGKYLFGTVLLDELLFELGKFDALLLELVLCVTPVLVGVALLLLVLLLLFSVFLLKSLFDVLCLSIFA